MRDADVLGQSDTAHTASTAPSMSRRIASIDIARGLIMALMALDHVRMYFSNAQFDPVAVGETDPAYFFTRWVTHLCAPGFFFLAGLSVHLAENRGQNGVTSSSLLFARGVWLILLELTIIGFAWSFTFGWFWFGVIWSLGAAMVCLAVLRWLPKLVLLAAAIALILSHNALPVPNLLPPGEAYELLYGAGSAWSRWVVFPVLPWLLAMVLGFAAGPYLAPDGVGRPRRFIVAGITALALFLVFRLLGFGQPDGGGVQWSFTFPDVALSFFNVEKYPPSAQYLLATLGVFALFLAIFINLEKSGGVAFKALAPLNTFGRVPFFFYVLHLFLIHSVALAAAYVFGWDSNWLIWNAMPDLTPPVGYGLTLAGVYLTWLIVLIALLPLCTAFSHAKDRSPHIWTKFL